MSEPAIFGLVRGGQARYFGDRWAFVFLHREILYGPDDFESWVTQLQELDEWSDDCAGGAIADYDRKTLVWHGDAEPLNVPRVAALYQRMLQAAWPGYEISFARHGIHDPDNPAGEREVGQWEGEWRPASLREAARLDHDEEDEDEEDDEEDVEDDEEPAGFDEEEVRAWVTIVGADGAIQHRHLDRLPMDLVRNSRGSLAALRELPAAAVPPEQVVAEGMWIDEANRSVGVWGARELQDRLPEIERGWSGWNVRWGDRGYEQHCEVAGPVGVPMTDAEALAKILPVILSTKRFDMSTVMGAMGGHLKKTAMKATGCLLVVICFPLLIFGLVSGNWQPVFISIAVTCGVVMAAFKVIEYKFKKSFLSNLPGANDERKAPPAAGPLDKAQRRQRIDKLLSAAALPKLSEIEPLFPEESELDLLS